MKSIQTWVIIGLAILLVISILTRPTKEITDLTPFKTQIAILEAEKREEQARFKEIVQKSNIRSQKDSLAIKSKDSKIQALEKKAAQQRVVVDTLILNNPDLEAFVNTQDSIIQAKQELIDTLKSALDFQIQIKEDLIRSSEEIQATFEKQLKSTEEIAGVYKKEVRKAKRANRWLRAAIPVVGVGMFFLGGQ